MIKESDLLSSGIEDANDLLQLAQEAKQFLCFHKWCGNVKEIYFAHGFAKLAVFFAEIEPLHGASPTTWVVVGDAPPMYLDTEYCPTAVDALEAYVEWMTEVCDRLDSKQDASDLPPILYRNSPRKMEMNPELIAILRSRLKFIKRELVDPFKQPHLPTDSSKQS